MTGIVRVKYDFVELLMFAFEAVVNMCLGAMRVSGNMDDVITRDTSTLSSSGHTLDLLGLSKTTPLNQTSSLFTGLPSRLQ